MIIKVSHCHDNDDQSIDNDKRLIDDVTEMIYCSPLLLAHLVHHPHEDAVVFVRLQRVPDLYDDDHCDHDNDDYNYV